MVQLAKPLTAIEIENVQSIDRVFLQLDKTGVYWVKGKSNIGKSALLKSIKALFTNVSNLKYKDLIRDNEDYFKITGYFGEDWVTLSRGSNDYYAWSIDGVVGREDKTNGKVPAELREFFDLYWTGDKVKRYINFTLVNEPLFFSETTSGDNTLILEKAIGTDRLTMVTKKADARVKEIARELKPYKTLIEGELENKERLVAERVESTKRLEVINRMSKVIDKEVEEYRLMLDAYDSIDKQMEIAESVMTLKDQVEGVDLEDLDNALQDLSELEDTKKVMLKIATAEKWLGENESKLDGVDLDKVEHELSIIETIKEYINNRDKIKGIEEDIAGIEAEVSELEGKEDDIMDGLNICPFCNQEIGDHKH